MARNTEAAMAIQPDVDNVIPMYGDDDALGDDEVVDDELVDGDQAESALMPVAPEPEREGLSTGQKVGAGAGIVGLLGLAGFGIYKLGIRLGWWGAGGGVVVDDPKDGAAGDEDSSKKPTGGGGSWRQRATGHPPNVSGDPEGYNTNKFPHPGAVRLTMTVLGYKVAYNGETLVPNNQPNPQVRSFQKDWNAVMKGLDSRQVKLPSVDVPSMLVQFRGLLKEDGIPGKNTLNAMEIAFNNWLRNAIKWKSLVEQAR